MKRSRVFAIVAPGVLVAATGVGAGDLATSALVGQRLGVAVLWAVLFGALFKYILSEGLARWQLATDTTLLEGTTAHLSRFAIGLFLVYFLAWSFLVAAALMSASGVAAHALLPLGDAADDKILYGVLHGLAGLGLVWFGGYALFEKLMSVAVLVMFLVVVATAARLFSGTGDVLAGLVWPRIPDAGGEGLSWTVALMGGVGGTVTVLCYGYWIRERGRSGLGDLETCRVDLAFAYAVTALFGVCMVIIGASVPASGRGAGLVAELAERLGEELGPFARWSFAIGAWCAIASSLLGVWQSAPYLFADLVGDLRAKGKEPRLPVSEQSFAYRAYLIGIALVPVLGLWVGFARMQKAYAFLGALFMPMLAVALLALLRRERVGAEAANRPVTKVALLAILAFFAYALLRIAF